jgi:tetratricopeptide (TPR) repeat protein
MPQDDLAPGDHLRAGTLRHVREHQRQRPYFESRVRAVPGAPVGRPYRGPGAADHRARLLARVGWLDQDWRTGEVLTLAYANEEAATHYEQALDAVRRLPDVTDTEKAAMWSGLGDAREQLGMFAEAIDAYRRAEALVRDDPTATARLALRRGRAREQSGAYTAALREVRTAAARLASVDTEESRRWRARLTAFEAIVRQGQERPREGLAVARRAVTEAETAGERFALAQAYSVVDWALIVLGRAGEAVLAQRALAIFEELGDLSRQAAALNNLGAAAYFSGDWTAAIAYYDRSAEASRRSGNEVQAALGAMNTGELLVNQGRLDEAEPILQEALRVLQASGSDAAHFAEMQFGRVALERGDLRLAERLMTHAQQDAAAIVATMGKNMKALTTYTYQQRVQMAYDGAVKSTTLNQISFDATGKPVVLQLSVTTPDTKERRLGHRAADKKKAEIEADVKQMIQLTTHYLFPDQAHLHQLAEGAVSYKASNIMLTATNFQQTGDAITVTAAASNMTRTSAQITTALSQSPVTIAATLFKALPRWSSHAERMVLSDICESLVERVVPPTLQPQPLHATSHI